MASSGRALDEKLVHSLSYWARSTSRQLGMLGHSLAQRLVLLDQGAVVEEVQTRELQIQAPL